MTTKLDLLGQRFDRWLVIAPAPSNSAGQTRWMCRCDCGTERAVYTLNLRRNLSPSCGCKRKDNNRARLTTHGQRHSRAYGIWSGMIQRCHTPTNSSFDRYGGRGIKVCDRWRYSFAAFLEDMGQPAEGTSLDRVDNDGDYEPGNCRWATIAEQSSNRRDTRKIGYNGESLTLSEWSRRLGLHHMTISDRLKRGWPLDRALAPKRP